MCSRSSSANNLTNQLFTMADTTTQKFIDDLITVIWNAEDPESVTNEMVARVFDFLNRGYKDLLTNNSAVQTERAERVAADAALQRTIDTLQLALQTVTRTANDAQTAATKNKQSIDNILGKNASQAIENFQEILNFLNGIKDNDSLADLLAAINSRLNILEDDFMNLEDADELQRERLDSLETAVNIRSVAGVDDITESGLYYLNIAGSSGNVLVVRRQQSASSPVGASKGAIIQYLFGASGLTFRRGTYLSNQAGTNVTWADWEEVGQKGAGNLINVTELVPPENGFYDLVSAIEAVPATHRALGRWITYRLGTGEWETKQFKGSTLTQWESADAWEDTGGKGKITGIKLNGKPVNPDAEGVVNITVDEIEVDETLSPNSTNPVQNNVVTQAINDLQDKTIANIDPQMNEEGTEIHLSITNKDGAEIAGCDIPVSTGGGGEQGSTAKIVLSAKVDNPIIREGSPVMLSYSYDHQYLGGDQGGESTGQRADIEITIKNGAVTTFSTTLNDVPAGTKELDITSYIRSGTTDITVKASVIDPETGAKRTRQATAQVRALTLALSSSYSLANSIAGGGYTPYETVTIPFTVQGSGSKTINLYLDGQPYDTKVVNKSGKTNGSFAVPMSALTVGRHNIQMVAELEASETLTLLSESIYIDLLKKPATGNVSTPFLGTMIIFPDGRIFEGNDYLTPTLEVGQFERVDFDFVAYNPDITPAVVEVFHDGLQTQSVNAPRTVQHYTNRFTTPGTETMMFRTGETEYHFNIEVVESSINLAEIADSLRCKFSAAGRSNNEENPAQWVSNGVTVDFEGFDWATNGWTGDTLRMTNGAKITINDTPFASDVMATGFTFEAELTCSNVADRDAFVLKCMHNAVGIQMTTEEAKILVSGGQALDTKFAPDIPIKIAFVVERKDGNRLLMLYVNGIRDRALQYQAGASLMQSTPAKIEISSEAADVELRNIRIYNRALSDDEMLANHMVDRPTADDMVLMFQKNDVLNDEDELDIDKLRAQGKGVMRIVGDVELVTQTNDKKFEVPVDIYFYSPYGKEYDFVIRNAGLRIQGTSSVTYPRKNWRIYFQRSEKYGTVLEVNGVVVPDCKYSFKPGARPVDIFCLKADFSDSSSTHNTGGVRIVNDVFRRCGWLTPPQAAYNGNYDVRIGVDGFPINLFYDNDGSGVAKFLGKYNFNNEKSDSHQVYGFEGIEGFNDEATLNGQRNKCICLEFLNNSEALCLFGTAEMTTFDKALEFRFKPDKTWATADEEDRAAVLRLWNWIQSCKGNPSKFLREYKDYFINDSPFAWYALTNYFMAVDNRAKNMMLATWDGIHWMFLPYDFDTLFGERNDSYLKFDYKIDFDTFDDSQQAYCFAGHDSVLWELVRACPEKLAEVARTIRANMSTEYVLSVFNEEMMGAWCERIYNKDGEFKYITPLLEQGRDYLYALQGSRYAHRTYTIVNRFALLDAEYCAGTYRADSFPLYLSYNFAANPRDLKLTASERYYFGYGMQNGDPTVSGLRADEAGDEVTLTFKQNLIVNDPQSVFGASRIRSMNLTNISHAIIGTLNLNPCIRLTELDASCAQGQNTLTNLVLEQCRNLRTLDVNGLNGLSSLNLANNRKLEIIDATTSQLSNVIFAQGGNLSTAKLPTTLQTLELRYLKKLALSGLVFSGTPAVTRLVVDNCPLIDWQKILDRCPSTTHLRVTGINESGRGELLERFRSMHGVDENGNNTDKCRLVGVYQLTKYVEEAEFEKLCADFPELLIKQPEWTVIKYDETVSDSKNISNLDNETGYDYDNDYKESAHVSAIMAKRHRVMAKYTAEAEMTVCPLDDTDSRRYHDGTEANLQGFNHPTKADEGDFMMFEPDRWCKGIDDFINRCHYHCFSSLKAVSMPEGRRLLADDMLEVRDRSACRVASTYDTFDECLSVFDDYRVYVTECSGYKQARWPAVNSSVYGAVFLDADNRIVGRAAANSGRMTDTSYLFTNVPENAVKLAFTCRRDVAFTFVWLTTSPEIHAIEPDAWRTGEYLVGVDKAYYGNMQIRSINGVVPTTSVSQSQFADYCTRRGKGFTSITYNMHRDIACLSWAKYGNRDCSIVCGYGSGSNTTLTGLTAFLGMKDTIKNPSAAIGAAGGWYYDDTNTLRSISSINALGYDNLWGNVAEWMAGVHSEYYVFHIADPETGEERKVKSGNVNDSWIVELHNGRFMDVVPVVLNGTETTHYGDKFWCSNSSARVVCRSGYNAYSNCGVSFTNASYDSSLTYAWYGSRLAFIGKIVYTLNVAAFLEAEAIA